jgi:DNA-binding NarL/FixJ family response regulator
VLKLVARGMTSKEISTELIVAKSTVDYHVKNIKRKLHAENRTAAATKAAEMGLVAVWKRR